MLGSGLVRSRGLPKAAPSRNAKIDYQSQISLQSAGWNGVLVRASSGSRLERDMDEIDDKLRAYS